MILTLHTVVNDSIVVHEAEAEMNQWYASDSGNSNPPVRIPGISESCSVRSGGDV